MYIGKIYYDKIILHMSSNSLSNFKSVQNYFSRKKYIKKIHVSIGSLLSYRKLFSAELPWLADMASDGV